MAAAPPDKHAVVCCPLANALRLGRKGLKRGHHLPLLAGIFPCPLRRRNLQVVVMRAFELGLHRPHATARQHDCWLDCTPFEILLPQLAQLRLRHEPTIAQPKKLTHADSDKLTVLIVHVLAVIQ